MTKELIITNGDSAAAMLSRVGTQQTILPWRDILYEGPVPHTIGLAELSATRAAYLAERYPQPGRDIAAEFVARDRQLAAHADFDVVALWFEHDLSDMLQLLQILDFFATSPRDRKSLRIVHSDRHLNSYTQEQLQAFAAESTPVGTARLNQAQEAWARWREPDPRLWGALLNRPRLGLKHLWSAVAETLDLFPMSGKGVSSVEHFILQLAGEQPATPLEIFERFCEECDHQGGRYMGDWSFFAILDRLASQPAPLLAGLEGGPFSPCMAQAARQRYLQSKPAPTLLGQKVRDGKANALELRPIDQWIGGCHLTPDELFTLDPVRGRLVAG